MTDMRVIKCRVCNESVPPELWTNHICGKKLMNRNQLREDFEKSFPHLDHKKLHQTNQLVGGWYYVDAVTRYSWYAWVSSFETYSNEPLTGEYINDF